MARIACWPELHVHRSVLAMLTAPLAAACIAALAPAGAHVHHSPDGTRVNWYPSDCCNDGDCRPVSRIQALSDGLVMTTEDGTTLFVNASKARRPSLDGRWHVCFGAGENPTVLCIFEPPGS